MAQDSKTPGVVDFIDFITLEASKAASLASLLERISDHESDKAGDAEEESVFPGICIIADDIRTKVQLIRQNALQVWKAHCALTAQYEDMKEAAMQLAGEVTEAARAEQRRAVALLKRAKSRGKSKAAA